MARAPRKLTRKLIAEFEDRRSKGMPIEDCCRELRVSTETFYKWKTEAEDGERGLVGEFGSRVLAFRKQGTLTDEFEGCKEWRTISHFKKWVAGKSECSHAKPLMLDSGETWMPEKWQLDPIADLLSGNFRAVWLIVPEGNGKTTLTAGFVLYLLEHQLTPEIPIGSATVTQAETLFRQIEGFIIRSGKLNDFNLASGTRRIDSRRTRGHTRVYPHNEKSGDGVIPSASVLDEGHLHPNLRLYRVWKGKYRKRKGPIMGISTAGEPGSEFEELRAKLLKNGEVTRTAGKKGQYIRAILGDTVLHDWGVRDAADAKDMKVVAAANPLKDISAQELQEKHDEPEMTDEHWLRRSCNIPTRVDGAGIKPNEWDALYEADLVPSRTAWAIGWMDLGWQIDCTAIGVLIWESDSRRVITGLKILKPPVKESLIVPELVALQREFQPVGWVFDPNTGGRQMVELLNDGRHPDQEGLEFHFIEHTQDNAPMSLAAARLDDAIRNGWLVHNGDGELRSHALNAVRVSLPSEKHRYDRPADAKKGEKRKKYPIDALTGLLMGNSVAVDEHDKPKAPIAIWGNPR